jgi:hypothetical protein
LTKSGVYTNNLVNECNGDVSTVSIRVRSVFLSAGFSIFSALIVTEETRHQSTGVRIALGRVLPKNFLTV